MVRAVIVFDPSKTAVETPGMSIEDATADAKMLYYYSPEVVEVGDRRNQSNLLQGVVEFGSFIDSPAEPAQSHSKSFSVDTEQLSIEILQVEQGLFLAIVVGKPNSGDSAQFLLRFYAYYKLLHGTFRDQLASRIPLSSTLDDFTPCFVAAECGPTRALPIAIRYAPIEPHSLVSVHALGLELACEFENWIIGFAMLFKGFLVSTSIRPEALAPLFTYLVMNPVTGDVSNTKLLKPPYGRIGTPAIARGGGSSAFGRCNYFDSENSSHGFLFGPTGAGESVFCPHVVLEDGTSGYLVAYIINGLMAVAVVRSVTEFAPFRRFENFFTDNNELNDEVVPLLRSDFAKVQNVAKEQFDFVYLNSVNKALIPHDASAASAAMKKGQSFFSGRFLYPFNDKGKRIDAATPEDTEISAAIERLAESSPDIAEIAVKASSNKGWKVFIRRGKQRQVSFDFKESKVPLWKVDADIANFLQVKFESVML
jgi:hypothetical protein